METSENVAAVRGADIAGKIADPRVGLRQRCVAQEQVRRKSLDGAAHHPVGVLRLHFAVDLDAQCIEGAGGGEDVGEIAEGVLVRVKPHVGGHIDAPADHILAFVVARGEPQHLDHACGRRVVATEHGLGDAQAHNG